MSSLTPRQEEILALIRSYLERYGYPPTRAEIAAELGFRSANAAEQHLRALARKGAIELIPGASRGLRLAGERPAGIPLVGRVAAGGPMLAEEHIDGRYRLDTDLFAGRPDYLLRVRGMSMRDAGILEGDLLAVRRSGEARPGQIVVARLAGEVTVKRFAREGERVLLLPENPDFAPISVDPERDGLAIEGIVLGVVRNLE